MIYGLLQFQKSKYLFNDDLKLWERLMHFNSCIHQKFQSNNLIWGYYTSPNFYRGNEYHYYKDPLSDCEILFSGNIYHIEVHDLSWKSYNNTINIPKQILNVFQKSGPSFVKLLNGDFAIAINDPSTNSFYLFRDHLGIHPLAFTIHQNILFFSSDQLSLCRLFQKNKNINEQFLIKSFKMIDFSQLPNSSVKKLLPGHFLHFSLNGYNVKKYWFPEKIKTNNKIKSRELFSQINSLLHKSIEIRSNKNFIAASHLSGGLDSGIVSAITRKVYSSQESFYAFSWTPNKTNNKKIDFDERKLVIEQCKLNKLEPVFTNISDEDFKKYISNPIKYLLFIEENKVLEIAKQKKVDVLFSGHGGDEFISIGNRGIDSDLFFRLNWLSLLKRYPLSNYKSLIKTLLNEIIFPFFNLLSFPVNKAIKNDTKYLIKQFKKPYKRNIKKFYFFKSRKQLHLGYLYCYYLSDRTEEWYVKGLHNGIQYRYPLLDKNIIEFMLTIPSKLLHKDGFTRIIPRELGEGILPENVRWKTSGMDPVLFNVAMDKILKFSLKLISEINVFRMNYDLHFIDFNQIEKEISLYKKNPDNLKYKNLLLTLFKINQIHNFTIEYRKEIRNVKIPTQE